MSDNVIELNKDNFEKEVSKNEGITIVDCWAPWCGPCRMMSPIFEELAGEMTDIKFCKLNVDDNREIANSYRVGGIPNFLMFKNGKAVASRVGGSLKEDLQDWILTNSKK